MQGVIMTQKLRQFDSRQGPYDIHDGSEFFHPTLSYPILS
jgi:hypothetical protein